MQSIVDHPMPTLYLLRRLSVLAVLTTAISCSAILTRGQTPIGTIGQAQVVLRDNVKLASKNSGIVVAIRGAVGAEIAKNAVLVELDSAAYAADVGVAKSQLAIAKIESGDKSEIRFLEQSKGILEQQLQRTQSARAGFENSVSLNELDRQRMELAQTSASLTQAESKIATKTETVNLRENELEVASIALAERSIRSPISGLIAELNVQVGEWVNAGQTVGRIIDVRTARVEAFVPLEIAVSMELGRRADFETKIGTKTVTQTGNITFISPEISPVNQDVKVWVEFNNSNRKLLSGMVGDLILYESR